MYIPQPEQYFEKYTYTKIESKTMDRLDVPSIHIHNLKFKNIDSTDVIFIPGRSFITVPAPPYYHSMIDTIGYFELLKEQYPDISLVFCSRDKHNEFKKHMRLKSDYVNFLLNLYSLPNSVWDIYDIKLQNLHFEEVVFLPNQSVKYQNRLLPREFQDSVGEFDWDTCFKIRLDAAKKLKEKILPLLTKKETKNKIYSARKQYNKNLTYQDTSRIFSEEDDLIEYFKNLNYEIVSLETMDVLDQLNLFYNASHIAGLKGSNIFGSIFSDPNTEVIQIYNSNFWRYALEDYFNIFELKVIDIAKEEAAELPFDPDTPLLSSKIIIEKLDEYFNNPAPPIGFEPTT